MEEKKKSIIILSVLNVAFNISTGLLGCLAITSENPIHIIIFGLFFATGFLIWKRILDFIKRYRKDENTGEENQVRDLYIVKQLEILVPILKKEIEVYKEVLYKINYEGKDAVCPFCGSHAVSIEGEEDVVLCTCSNCGNEWRIDSEKKAKELINNKINRELKYVENPYVNYTDVNNPKLGPTNVDTAFINMLKSFPIEAIYFINNEEDLSKKDILKYLLEEFEITIGVELIGFKSLKYVWKEKKEA